MEDRLNQLEKTVGALAELVESLQARLVSLEQASPLEPPESTAPTPMNDTVAVPAATEPSGESSLVAVLSLAGRTFLVLAGAFLLRALTEAGIMPHASGVALGMVYAVAWIVIADRTGAKGHTLSASFYGVAAVLIAYPLLLESTTTLAVLSPAVSTVLITSTTGIFMLVAWRRKIYPLAWAVTLATLIACPALIFATAEMELFTIPVLFLGAVTVWLAYSRQWRFMRWIAALVADLCILPMVYLATQSGELTGRFSHLSSPAVQALSIGLLLVYLGSFVLHTLVRRHDITVFEVLQSAVVLLVGFGGAVYVARSEGSGSMVLGLSSLTAAGGCYAAAFAFVRRRLGMGSNFFFYAWLALILTMLGSLLVISEGLLPWSWMALAVAAAFLGGHFDRVTLRAHCAIFSAAAAWHSGMIAAGIAAFTVPALGSWPARVLVMLGFMMVCYAFLVTTQMGREVRWLGRLPRFTVLLLAVLGIGGLAVVILVRFIPGITDTGPSGAAVIRTAVLAGAAILLAALGSRGRWVEMSWLVYPVLIAGGTKLLLEDLRHGQPLAIFLGFAFYGIALITAPRLLRRARVQAG